MVEYYGGLPEWEELDLTRLPPVLILHGDADRNVRVEEAYKLEQVLRASGVSYEMHIYAGAGHGFRGEDRDDAIKRTPRLLRVARKTSTLGGNPIRMHVVYEPVGRIVAAVRLPDGGNQRAGSPWGIAPPRLPQIRTCPSRRHPALQLMTALRDPPSCGPRGRGEGCRASPDEGTGPTSSVCLGDAEKAGVSKSLELSPEISGGC